MPNPSGKINQRERAICGRVKEFREGIKWPQRDFAARLGISLNQLASIEYGRTPLRYSIAWQIRFVFGPNLSWFASRTFSPNDKDLEPWPSPEFLSNQSHLLSEIADELNDPIARKIFLRNKQIHSKTKPDDRATMFAILKEDLADWLARVPDLDFSDFTSQLVTFAENYLEKLPIENAAKVKERYAVLIWDAMRLDVARRVSQSQEMQLTSNSPKSNNEDVKPQIPQLIEKVKRKASKPGSRAELARLLDVAPARVTEWLSGQKEPSGENTLRLLKWVEQ